MTGKERAVTAARMKASGMKRKEIAAHFGVSVSRAGELIRKGERLCDPRLTWLEGLSWQLSYPLLGANYTSKEGVRDAVLNGTIRLGPRTSAPETGVVQLGKVLFPVLCRWLELTPADVPALLPPYEQLLLALRGNPSNSQVISLLSEAKFNPELIARYLRFASKMDDVSRRRLEEILLAEDKARNQNGSKTTVETELIVEGK